MQSLVAWFGDLLALRRTKDSRDPDESRVPYSPKTLAGPLITPDTAMKNDVVWAAHRYLTQTVAVLPWRVMREVENGNERAPTHPVDWMLWRRPNPEWSSFQFRETLTGWAIRHGNGYAEIERDMAGRPLALWPIRPDRVTPQRDLETNELIYEVDNGSDGKSYLPRRDMFHIRGYGDGPVGISVIELAAQSIGWAQAAQLFGAAFFGNGMTMGGFIELKNGMKPEGKRKFEAELKQKFGGPMKAWNWLIGEPGAVAKPFGVEPNKGQFLETMQHQIDVICRWIGVPPHKVMHLLHAHYNNVEHQSIEVVVDAILPWSKRFEDEADEKLFGGQNRRGYYTKLNLNGLMRGDAKSRAEFYQLMRNIGVFSVNEIRLLEDINPIGPEGDKRVMQSQYTTLEQIGLEPTPEQIASMNDRLAAVMKAYPDLGRHNGGPPLDDHDDEVAATLERIVTMMDEERTHA